MQSKINKYFSNEIFKSTSLAEELIHTTSRISERKSFHWQFAYMCTLIKGFCWKSLILSEVAACLT